MPSRPSKLKRIRPIGLVETEDGNDSRKLRNLTVRVRLGKAYARGLIGIGRGSHALVIFQMSRATFRPKKDLIYRPHNDKRWGPAGIFAQRCPHRPNLLGVTTVEIVGIEPDAILVRGLDAEAGTPVLDIKPYVPAFDRPLGRLKVVPWFR